VKSIRGGREKKIRGIEGQEGTRVADWEEILPTKGERAVKRRGKTDQQKQKENGIREGSWKHSWLPWGTDGPRGTCSGTTDKTAKKKTGARTPAIPTKRPFSPDSPLPGKSPDDHGGRGGGEDSVHENTAERSHEIGGKEEGGE